MSAPGTTPGPWAVSKQKARRVTSSGVVICNAVLRNQGGPKHKSFMKNEHEAEANAHLIAAAPNLYEAANLLAGFAEKAATLDWNEDRNVSWAAVVAAKARAALAKARGEA